MIYRAFYSSPYMSHVSGPEAAIADAMRAITRLPGFAPVLSLLDVPRATRSVVWSPLVEGDIIRAVRADTKRPFAEEAARQWCLDALPRFNVLIVCKTIPRRPGASSFCDREESWARDHGMMIMTDVDIQEGRYAL